MSFFREYLTCDWQRDGEDVMDVLNSEVAWILREIADMLEFKGENEFKVLAYRKAARSIAGLSESVTVLYREGRLSEIPGIGRNISAKIGEIIENGDCRLHRELIREIPPGIMDLFTLPGIGPKKARFFYEHLKVSTVAELEEAARQGRVRQLPGMGVRREVELLRSIEAGKRWAGRYLLSVARELAGEMLEFLKGLPEVKRAAVAGEVRRWQETVSQVELVVSSDSPLEVVNAITGHPKVRKVLSRHRDHVKVTTWPGEIPVELRVVAEEEFWPVLVWRTGSEEHYCGLREAAYRARLQLDHRGLYTAGEERDIVPVTSEEEIYHRIGLPWIAPELREGRGEIEAARSGRLQRLVKIEDIKGDLHLHSNWSDGVSSILELVDRAREKGYRYLAVTDHSRSLRVARGLSEEKLMEQHRVISELNKDLKDFRILTGVEVEILADGSLDYSDEILKEIDLVVASVHSAFKQDQETMTERILTALANEHVDVIGHPTGRLLGYREPYELDVERLIEAAARYNKILEINASPDRLDLNDRHAALAKEYGVKVAISTDAHDSGRMDEMMYGVMVARRAWLEAGDVVNALELPELLRLLGRG